MTTPTRSTGVSPTKAVRTPQEAMAIARKTPGVKVLYSEGHEKYGARLKAHQIRAGKRGPWVQYHGEVATSALKQHDGTYNVYIYVKPSTASSTDD